jgi:general stress protein 26
MKTTTATSDPGTYAKLQDLVDDVDIAMVTTVTPDGALRSRPMATREFGDDGILWFFTADDSGKVHDLEAEHAVNVSYAEPKKQRYVSVSGSASVIRDRQKVKELWLPMFKNYFPQGLDDPHLALLQVKIESAEYWDADSGNMVQLLNPAKSGRTAGDPNGGEHVKVRVQATPASG